eukprot:gene10883-biopygen767
MLRDPTRSQRSHAMRDHTIDQIPGACETGHVAMMGCGAIDHHFGEKKPAKSEAPKPPPTSGQRRGAWRASGRPGAADAVFVNDSQNQGGK